MTPKEAADFLRVGLSFLQARRKDGEGPRFMRYGDKKILYRVPDLIDWQARCLQTATSSHPL
jgi:hypothetical protein